MSNVVDLTKARFEKKRLDEWLSWVTYQATWSLMIGKSFDREEIVCVFGYPEAEHEIHAVRHWVHDNQSKLKGKSSIEAVRFVNKELSTKLNDYFGSRRWQRADEYER